MLMKFFKKSLLITVIFVLYSCDSGNNVIHPNQKFKERIKSSSNSKKFFTNSSNEFSAASNDIFKIGEGANISDVEFMYGVRNIIKDKNGLIYVSLPSENQIKVFDKDGIFKFHIGNSGRGPGEFMNLTKIEYDPKRDYLIALDRYEIEIFSLGNDTVFHKKTIFTKTESVTDICVSKGHLFINGFRITKKESSKNIYTNLGASLPIHQYSLDSLSLVKSFGENYKSSSNYGPFEGRLSKTLISCSINSNILVSIYENFPLIKGYDLLRNKKIWETGIRDLEMVEFKESFESEPLLGKVKSLQEKYFYQEIISIDENKSLLQIGNRYPSSASNEEKLRFLTEKFTVIPVIIDHATGALEFFKKQNRVYYFIDDKFEIYSYPLGNYNDGEVLHVKKKNG